MKIKVTADRWPWQSRTPHWSHSDIKSNNWGWKPVPGMGRFGGGWNYNLGIQVGSKSVIVNLIFGQVIIKLITNKRLKSLDTDK